MCRDFSLSLLGILIRTYGPPAGIAKVHAVPGGGLLMVRTTFIVIVFSDSITPVTESVSGRQPFWRPEKTATSDTLSKLTEGMVPFNVVVDKRDEYWVALRISWNCWFSIPNCVPVDSTAYGTLLLCPASPLLIQPETSEIPIKAIPPKNIRILFAYIFKKLTQS